MIKIKKITSLILVIVILLSGGYLIKKFVIEPQEVKALNEKIMEEAIISTTVIEAEKEEVRNYFDFTLLKEKNSDTAGMLEVLGTKMPVVQTKELDANNKYLHTSFDGKNSSAGTLFIASDAVAGEANVMTIYGHNMKNGTMFGQLSKYRELDFLKENPTFNFASTTDEVINCYKIVAVCSVSTNYQKNFYFPQSVYNTEEEFNKFKSEIQSHSFFELEEFSYDDKIIILCTCAYGFEGERTLVVAKLDNNSVIDTENYRVNADRVLPNP